MRSRRPGRVDAQLDDVRVRVVSRGDLRTEQRHSGAVTDEPAGDVCSLFRFGQRKRPVARVPSSMLSGYRPMKVIRTRARARGAAARRTPRRPLP